VTARIVFGMPEEEYRAVDAIGSGGICDLLVSVTNYWRNSSMNPERDDTSSASQKMGKALHCRLLEGTAAFNDRFAILPEKPEGCLETVEQLKAWLNIREVKVSSKDKKADLVEKVLAYDPEAPVWDAMLSRFGAANAGRTFLSAEEADLNERMARFVEMMPVVRDAVAAGESEVSIFWTDEETGAPMKARLDKLNNAIVDLKSFANTMDRPIADAVHASVSRYRYDLQARHYLAGLEAIKRAWRDGKLTVEGPHDPEWLASVLARPPHRFCFVFVESAWPPNVETFWFASKVDGDSTTPLYWTQASGEVQLAATRYVTAKETFGTDPWLRMPELRYLKETDLPLYHYRG
jgi:hypothetical protein